MVDIRAYKHEMQWLEQIAMKSGVMRELCKDDFPKVASRLRKDESEVGPGIVSRSLLVTVQPRPTQLVIDADATRHAKQDLFTVFTMYSCLGQRRRTREMAMQPRSRPDTFTPASAAVARHLRPG